MECVLGHIMSISQKVGNFFGYEQIGKRQDRKKMSKRDGKTSIDEYIETGYLPEALINFIAFLGWNPGTEKEIYARYRRRQKTGRFRADGSERRL